MKKLVSMLLIFLGIAAFSFSEDSTNWDSVKNDFKEAGSNIKDAAENIKNGTKEAIKEVSKTVENNKLLSLQGTLKRGLFSKTNFTLEADDGTSYKLKTLSGSDDSYKKLSGFKNQKISVTGILNKQENTITMTTYKSIGE